MFLAFRWIWLALSLIWSPSGSSTTAFSRGVLLSHVRLLFGRSEITLWTSRRMRLFFHSSHSESMQGLADCQFDGFPISSLLPRLATHFRSLRRARERPVHTKSASSRGDARYSLAGDTVVFTGMDKAKPGAQPAAGIVTAKRFPLFYLSSLPIERQSRGSGSKAVS